MEMFKSILMDHLGHSENILVGYQHDINVILYLK
jgi:hypothetical protein